eukprot:15672238-Heterocapsa_arctica.AAC.1
MPTESSRQFFSRSCSSSDRRRSRSAVMRVGSRTVSAAVRRPPDSRMASQRTRRTTLTKHTCLVQNPDIKGSSYKLQP